MTVNVLANDSDPDGDALSRFHLHAGGAWDGGIGVGRIALHANERLFGRGQLYVHDLAMVEEERRPPRCRLTVQAAGQPCPLAVADSATTQAATAVTINVLANDSDPDGDALAVSTFTQAAHGTVATVSGGLRYTPTSGYSGGGQFYVYDLRWPRRNGDASCRLTVQAPLNRAPVAVADTATTQAATPVTINVLANDSDPDSDALAVSTFTQAAHGTVASVTGGLRYTPTSGYSGGDSFTYTISDGRGGTATATVSLTVQAPPNRAPVAVADSATTQAATPVTVNVLANDSDPDGDALAVSTFTQAAHGTVASVTGGLRYTPTSGYSGGDSFTYTISDGRGGTATATVSLTVQAPPNRAPVAVADSTSTQAGTAVSINVLANDSDPDGDALAVIDALRRRHMARWRQFRGDCVHANQWLLWRR